MTVGVADATGRSQGRSIRRIGVMAGRRVDTESNPAKDPIMNRIAQERVFKERIRVRVLSLNLDDVVIRILGNGDLVRVVRIGSLHLADQVLVEEELANVGDVSAGQSVIRQDVGVRVGDDMDMGRTAGVVTGEQSLELGHAVRVRFLNAAQERLVEVRGVVAIAVHRALNARVHTSGIAVPHVPVQILDWLAGVDVDELAVKNERDSGLAIANVGSDKLSLHPERTNFSLWCENASWVLVEQCCLGGVGSDMNVGMVGGVDDLVKVPRQHGPLAIGMGNGRTTSASTLVDATLLELVGAFVQGSASIVQETSLRHGRVRAVFMLSGVSHCQTTQGQNCKLGEMHSGEKMQDSIDTGGLEGKDEVERACQVSSAAKQASFISPLAPASIDIHN